MNDALNRFIESQNRLVMREWAELGEVDGSDQRAIDLAEKQGERFKKGLARLGYVQLRGRYVALN